jgi:hypothetical protein
MGSGFCVPQECCARKAISNKFDNSYVTDYQLIPLAVAAKVFAPLHKHDALKAHMRLAETSRILDFCSGCELVVSSVT